LLIALLSDFDSILRQQEQLSLEKYLKHYQNWVNFSSAAFVLYEQELLPKQI